MIPAHQLYRGELITASSQASSKLRIEFQENDDD
jgi:hypothetical protein